jgi:tRNA pseudouridine32 synthase/23S rRNA pseudouridine746 synthase
MEPEPLDAATSTSTSSLEVLYADPWLLVVNKPSGLLSQSGLGPDLVDCVPRRLAPAWGELQLVHRLDRDTSGLLVLARDADSHRKLSRSFAERQVRKTYLAEVAGQPAASAGTIDQSLARVSRRPPLYGVDPAGKASRTDWQLLEGHGSWSRLLLIPHTGRSHQLRVHLAWLGHPILGDPLYAPAAARALAPRLRLHAHRLAFAHPVHGERLELCAPVQRWAPAGRRSSLVFPGPSLA